MRCSRIKGSTAWGASTWFHVAWRIVVDGEVRQKAACTSKEPDTSRDFTVGRTDLVVVRQELEAREAERPLLFDRREELLHVLVLALEPHGPEEVVQHRLRPVGGRLEEELFTHVVVCMRGCVESIHPSLPPAFHPSIYQSTS